MTEDDKSILKSILDHISGMDYIKQEDLQTSTCTWIESPRLWRIGLRLKRHPKIRSGKDHDQLRKRIACSFPGRSLYSKIICSC